MGKMQSITPRKPRRGDTVACLTCGQEFYRQPFYVRADKRYCSQPCWNQAQRSEQIIKVCASCGVEFPVRPSEIAIKTCSRACQALNQIKRPTGRTHNGKPVRKDEKGYVWIWEPTHPNKSYGGWQPEHRMVAEHILGRYLTTEEQVDHINQQKDDNRPENLQVLDAKAHAKKTQAENLGALKALRAQVAEHEAAMAEQARELAEMKARLAALESSTD